MSEILTNLINGAKVSAQTDASTAVVDPATGQEFLRAPISSEADVDAAYSAADAAFVTWRDSTPAERQLALLKLADAVESRADDLIAAESRNTGKPLHLTATDEVPPCVDQLRYFAGAARILEGLAAGEYLPGHTSWIRREPIGVVGQVTPWNYPLMMAIWKIAPALAAGNTIVLKPSDTTPVSTALLAEIAADVLPPGVLNVVLGDRTTGHLVVDHPRADMVAITGSIRAGKEVASTAAARVKRVHLELGGKAPAIVMPDADLAAAAEAIAVAGTYNAGQDCTAATRVLVHEAALAEFLPLLAAATTAQRTGQPTDADAAFGPVNNAGQLDRILGFLDRLPAHAELVTGGARQGEAGFFVAPTLVAGLHQDDELVQDEVFGPVLGVQTFATLDEAVRLANGVRYGLASSIFTADHSTAMKASRDLDFGCVWINTHIPFLAEMPHGGFKESGYGKDLSRYGFEDYTRIKHVMSAWG